MNKRGFTLIELLAVIVILGILMLIAIPSVTKYIDKSKKETYIDNAYAYIEAVRKDVIAGNLQTPNQTSVLLVKLSSITLEKGSNKSPYGEYIDDKSYVLVKNVNNNLEYYFAARDNKNYEIPLTKETALTTNVISKTEESNIHSYDGYSKDNNDLRTNLYNGNLNAGFINLQTGVIEESSSYPNSKYLDKLTVQKGHTYKIIADTDTIRWRAYDENDQYLYNISTQPVVKISSKVYSVILLFPKGLKSENIELYDMTQEIEFIKK